MYSIYKPVGEPQSPLLFMYGDIYARSYEIISRQLSAAMRLLIRGLCRQAWLLFLIATGLLTAQAGLLVATNSTWAYKKGTNEASSPDLTAWRMPAFADASWPRGAAPFYYDTKIPPVYSGKTAFNDMQNNYLCVFLRQPFNVTDPAATTNLVLRALCDDGFVAWINGTEVARYNVVAGPVTYNSHATTSLTATAFTNFTLTDPQAYLVAGSNLLAVQLFNINFTSSDLLFDAELVSVVPDTTPPSVLAFNPAPGTVNNLTQMTVTFSEPVKGVTADDLYLNDEPALSVSGSGASYTFTFLQPVYGAVQLSWDDSHSITDYANPPNRFDQANPGANAQYLLLDQTPPTIAVLNPPAGSIVHRLTQIEVTFSEPVDGLHASDLLISGQPATNLIGGAAGPYVFQFPEPAAGPVRLAWSPTQAIHDSASPPNAFAGGEWALTLDPNALAGAIVINEFVAANLNGLKDEDGEPQDWVELFNPGSNAVNLVGWGLSDNDQAPDRWLFPGMTLAPGQYAVVFASGKDRKNSTPRLHTNFKLNPAGSYLGLCNAESPRQPVSEFRPHYPEQRTDYSYGRDAGGLWRYFAVPSPGAKNGVSTIQGLLPPVHFSTTHGFFNQPFKLLLSVNAPGAAIRYTTDGTEPTAQSGSLFTAPLTINHTTIFRAAAFQSSMLPSLVDTHTYLFLEDVLQQPAQPPGFPTGNWGTFPPDYEMDPKVVNDPAYHATIKDDLMAIPSLSIVCNVNDMFGAANGIYTHSSSSYTGPAWTRPCSIEILYPDGQKGLQTDCGIRMHGGGSREQSKEKKHSFRLLFKADYGASKLEFPFFPDSPLTEFNTLVLRADYNNHWTHMLDNNQRSRGGLVRDALFKDVQAAMGAQTCHSRYVHLYINGLYWGVYNPSERPDANFAAAYCGGNPEDYDAFNGTFPGTPVDGTAAARNALLAINNLDNPAQYDLIKQYLDIGVYIDYFILQVYGANQDWGTTKNWYSFRRRLPGAGFNYVCWDSERTLEGINDRPPGVSSAANLNSLSPDGLQAKLSANPEYRLTFADHVRKHFFNDGVLTPASMIKSWQARAAQIDRAIVGESARWGDLAAKQAISPLPYSTYTLNTPYTRNQDWLGEQGRLLNQYFPARSAVILDQFRAAGLYPSVAAPDFNQQGGPVAEGFKLVMSAPAGAIYYTTNGVDPRVPLSGALANSALLYAIGSPLVLYQSAQVKARCLNGGVWSAMTEASFLVAEPLFPLRLTEIMYHPSDSEVYEFLELYNSGGAVLDLTGVYWDGIDFIFPPGSTMSPGATAVLIPDLNPAAFAARNPGLAIAGTYRGSLANGGEKLRLFNPQGLLLLSVTYKNSNGWPATANGGGRSLEIIDPVGDPNDPANWQASVRVGGSPGLVSVPPTPVVRLNEIMAANSTLADNGVSPSDWIELYNDGAQTADLSDWSLTDDGNPRKFVFPTGTTLAPRSHLVIWCDHQTNAPGLHTDFGLKKEGVSVFLYDAQTNRLDAVTLGPQVTNYSVGRFQENGQAWQLSNPSPGLTNTPAALASPSNLVINEWLANSAPGDSDWLELYNRDPNFPVALSGLYLASSNSWSQIRSLSFIPPGGYLRLWADENPGVDHLDFKLPAAGGVLALADGMRNPIDLVVYGPQSEGVSQGRLPDSSANIVSFVASASPGAPNYLPAYSGPRLNEIMARNVSATTNLAGHVPDWIELFNPGQSTFDLAGMSLSLDAVQPGQWRFPNGAAISAQGYLLVWCDASRPASVNLEPELNLGRRLAGDAGAVYLFSAAGQQVDAVEYGFQVADLSIGWAGANWQLMAVPTPGAANSLPASLASTANLRINEWMALPAQGDDWFELYNLASQPVALSGLFLTDDPSLAGQTNFQVGPLSFIGPGGKVRWVADGTPKKGRDHVNFALDGQGDMLRLYNPNFAIIDEVYLAVQTPGISEGRSPDGGTNIVLQVTARLSLLLPSDPSPFLLRLSAAPGSSFALQASSNLVDWISVTTNTAVTSTIDFLAPESVNYPWRFYRAKRLP